MNHEQVQVRRSRLARMMIANSGMRVYEIAQIMGISRQSVASRIKYHMWKQADLYALAGATGTEFHTAPKEHFLIGDEIYGLTVDDILEAY